MATSDSLLSLKLVQAALRLCLNTKLDVRQKAMDCQDECFKMYDVSVIVWCAQDDLWATLQDDKVHSEGLPETDVIAAAQIDAVEVRFERLLDLESLPRMPMPNKPFPK